MSEAPHSDHLSISSRPVVRCISGLLIFLLGTASVATRSHGQEVDANFPTTDGIVEASAVEGNTLYVGGNFAWVGSGTGRFVVIDSVSGARDASWPTVEGEYVETSAPDGNGGWYIGGRFTSVRGVPRMNVAHILADGSVGPWNPGVNVGDYGSVRAIAVSGATVYLGVKSQEVVHRGS